MPPFLTFFHFDADGNKQPDVPIFTMTRPSFLHDFAITKKHAIFGDIQIGMNLMDMLVGGGSLVGADLAKVPRIGHTLERMDLIHTSVEKMRIDLKTYRFNNHKMRILFNTLIIDKLGM
ncbi:hypothetical protein RJ640_000326 [Escallonia rubra]|uniref:Uncharacterized protein n=1 Tax=Escallonia rubra TaxID=112253 RepID=A0AA88RF03_9ASTE|nr:hypothetical protein RJ640_000326 [Escallonia rubra]